MFQKLWSSTNGNPKKRSLPKEEALEQHSGNVGL